MIQLTSGQVIEEGAPLKSQTSWLVGGDAEFLASPKTLEELHEALGWARSMLKPVTILSGGTNVLISDKGVRGLTISLRKFSGTQVSEVEVDGVKKLSIECLSGTSKSELLKIFLKYRLEPALFLAGLPGDVGGGVVMNAGVSEMMKPREFVEITDWIEVLRGSGEIVRFDSAKLKWSYRHCEGWKPGVIVRVGISAPLEPSDDILARVKAANQVRLSKQPLDMPSCGSVFKNPEGTSSGKVIEAAGLKGFTIGGAKVSEKHANFIVNTGEATASDIDAVIKHVQKAVQAAEKIALKTEVVYLGNWK